ncbi:hypothetical protein [Streptomyces sediminimaris]|uniref:hypothetical protein n=1 Tax=Streptomyces sediminimaris TaxID=3383721 RepID=UPI00399A6DFC
MNTERPDNDAAGPADERSDGTRRRATGAGAGASGGAAEPGPDAPEQPREGAAGSGTETAPAASAGTAGTSGTTAPDDAEADAGTGTGSGADTGTGSVGTGADTEPGGDTGIHSGTGSGGDTGPGSGFRTGTATGIGANSGSGTETDTDSSTRTGDGSRPDTDSGSSSGTERGTGSGAGTGTDKGTDKGTPSGTGSGGDAGTGARSPGDGGAAVGHAEVPGPHELAPVPPIRRRTPVLVASVAAAVLLVGGGGAYLAMGAAGGSGAGTDSGARGEGGTPPPLRLDGYSGGGTNGIAPGEPNPYGVTYKVEGSLPGGPGSAPVYRASGEVGKDAVARLAKALGLDGTPVVRGQSWQVGPAKDGFGPSLVVDRQAPGTWMFRRYAAGTDNCNGVATCTKDPANPAGRRVGEADALRAAAPVLKAIGQDDAKVDASQVMGAQRVVNADPRFGGLPTSGWATDLTVSAQGEVVGGTGRLAAPAKSDTYPVLSARRTVELMNSAPTTDHRMGIGGCVSPLPMKDRPEAPCGRPTTGPAPRETVTIESAVFGLATRSVDGRPALVPSWLFRVRGADARGGFTVTYPAVDPRYLASDSPASTPPATTAPGDEPTSAPTPRDVRVNGYTADGRELTVSFTGGVCADYEATADESADQVRVAVTEKPWKGKVCIMIAKEFHKTVRLERPLGDRTVEGSDGSPVPPAAGQGARLPGTTPVR